MQWVDRAGRRLSSVGEPALFYAAFAASLLSPDGKKAAVEIYEPNIDRGELWIMDVETGVRRRFTSGPSGSFAAVWSPDGSRIAFSSDRTHQADLYEKAVNGSVSEQPLLEAEGQKIAADWSSDSRYILYWEREPRGLRRVGLMALPTFGDRKPIVVLEPAAREDFRAKFSPGGRRIAYATDEAGRSEVFVTSFPTPTEKWQVSSAGGTMPHWRKDGRELFLRHARRKPDGRSGHRGGVVRGGHSQATLRDHGSGSGVRPVYDPAPDGQRFLMSLPADTSTPPLNVIVNSTAALKK